MTGSFSSLDFLSKLVACHSITPVDDNAMSVVISHLQSLGFATKIYEFGSDPAVKNLYAEIGDGPHNLCFAGHVDVVPPGQHQHWYNNNPFKLEIKEDIVYGRGLVDMKGAISCFIGATQKFLSNTPDRNRYKLSILLTGDEEGDGTFGTRMLLPAIEKDGVKIDYCIVGEPSSSTVVGDSIRIGRRGSLSCKLTVVGKQGHVAYPDKAINPIEFLIKILDQLQSIKLDDGNEYFQPSSLVITDIFVGNQTGNVIPAEAEARFNIRFNTNHTEQDLIAIIEKICSQFPEITYQCNYNCSAKPFISKYGNLIKTAREILSKDYGIEPDINTGGGTSDARFIKDYCDEVLELGLLNATAHQIDECASLNDLIQLENMYYSIISKVING